MPLSNQVENPYFEQIKTASYKWAKHKEMAEERVEKWEKITNFQW